MILFLRRTFDGKKIIVVIFILILCLILFYLFFENFYFQKQNKLKINYKIGFVIDQLGDKGFTYMQVEGVKNASDLYNIKYKIFVTGTFDKIKQGIIQAKEEGFNIILCGNGILAEKPIMEIAKN